MLRIPHRIALAVVVALGAACGQSTPTQPSNASQPASSSSAQSAAVSNVLPATLPPSTSVQTLVVNGTNFKPGLSVEFVFAPGTSSTTGSTTTITGAAIHELTDSSFQVDVTVSGPGSYSLRVTNPSAPPSGSVTVTSEPSTSAAPTIAGTSPRTPHAKADPQPLYVVGTNFQQGVVAELTLPDGSVTNVDSSEIMFGSPTVFRMLHVFSVVGAYSLRAINPSQLASEPFRFNVEPGETPQPPAPPTPPMPVPDTKPVVTSTNPVSPTQSTTAKPVYVLGTGFLAGLTVELKGPDGPSTTIGGSSITLGNPTVFQMMVVLPVTGEYDFRVTNTNGQHSDWFKFTVGAPETPVAPVITGTLPETITASTAPQYFFIGGTHFVTGLTVLLTRPDGSTTTYSGTSDIPGVVTGGAYVHGVLGTGGTYTVKVTNPNGQSSNVWSFEVHAPPAPVAPTVSHTAPESITASANTQPVYVFGTGFQTGLTVALTAPGGGTTTVSGSSINLGSTEVFQMMVVLAVPGTYSFKVTNPNGLQTDVKTFIVH